MNNKSLFAKFFSPLLLATTVSLSFMLDTVSASAADSVPIGSEIVPADTLLYAAWTSDLSAVKAAIAEGIRPDHVYRHSPRTALNAAAYNGHIEVVNYLVAEDANVNLKIIGDGAPLILAVRGGHTDVVQALLAAEANPDIFVIGDEGPAYHIAASGNVELAEILFNAGADFDHVYRGDGTPLMIAIKRGHDDLAKWLIAKGVDVNKSSRGDGTPLIIASRAGNLAVAKSLVESGANVNVHIRGDDTPLINAIRNSSTELVDFLIKSGADVNQQGDKDRSGQRRTPLNQAELAGNSEINLKLEQAGARQQR